MVHMHRAILGLESTDKREGDHIDHQTLNNRRSNLRIVTHQENHFNRRNTKGYYWDPRDRKFVAQIVLDGKKKPIGRYDNWLDARNAYVRAKREFHKIMTQ